jgi:hypothetical protein
MYWPIKHADEIYNAKPQKSGRERLENNAKPDAPVAFWEPASRSGATRVD